MFSKLVGGQSQAYFPSAKEGKSYYMGRRLLADGLAGYSAGFLVTPVVSSVDRALAENASGKATLWASFTGSLKEMARAPLKAVRSPAFTWIWLVYGSTYVAANAVETICAKSGSSPALAKWIATSSTNTVTCIAKDQAFAKMFGTKVASNVPPGAYAAWLGRDLISMGVFFTLPPIVGKQIAGITGSEKSGYYAAQIGLPLIVQTITTPMHLLGYDVYNNPKNTLAQRITFLQKDYFQNVGMRMIRMAPPWSFGTIGNREFRSKYTDLTVPAHARNWQV
jgi:hypothetical protein